MGSERSGWTLTQKGLEFARGMAAVLADLNLGSDRRSLKEMQWRSAERRRLVASEAYEAYRIGGQSALTRRQAEAFFRLDDYVVGSLRERKIVRVLNAFSEDLELGDAVRAVAAMVRESRV